MPTAIRDPRAARVGDLLRSPAIAPRSARRIDATALLAPGSGPLDRYVEELERRTNDFAGWDGRTVQLTPDGASAHRLLILDRYGQVYATFDAAEAVDLPSPDDLEEWFRFLATACPECGVIDDPTRTGPTP
jgi:hypothetical protein